MLKLTKWLQYGNKIKERRMMTEKVYKNILTDRDRCCGYCYRFNRDDDILYGVRLRASVKEGWQGLMFICLGCKDILKGKFKYERTCIMEGKPQDD